MDSVTAIGVFVSVVVVIGVMIVYWMYGSAINAAGKSNEFEKQMAQLDAELKKAEKQLQQFAHLARRKSRAYLYVEIDGRIHSAYQHANQEIQQGLSQNKEIEIIQMPDFTLSAILDLAQNREKVNKSRQNRAKYESLRRHLSETLDQIGIIHGAVEEEEQINARVARELDEFRKKIKHREDKLIQAKYKPGSRESNILQPPLALARQQIDASKAGLSESIPDKSLNYGRGAIVLMGLEQLLNLWDVDWDIFQVPFNYELDISTRDATDAMTKIVSSLPMVADMDFVTLHQRSLEIEKFKNTISAIRAIFDAFKINRSEFEEKRRKVCDKNLDSLTKKALDTEKEWGKYWGSPSESPERWDPLLQKKGLPSERLKGMGDALKKMCASEILNMKQSNLPAAIRGLVQVLGDFSNIEEVIASIKKNAEEHSQAKNQVEVKLDRTGSATIMYESVVVLRDEKKCSPHTEERIQTFEDQYLRLCNQAKMPKNANYPLILDQLKNLNEQAASIKKEHEKELAEKKKQIENINKLTNELKQEYLKVKRYFPTDDLSWDQVSSVFEEIGSGYLSALNYFPKMDRYERGASQKLKWLKDEYSHISLALREMKLKIDKLKTRIETEKGESKDKTASILKTKWVGPLKSKLDEIERDIRKYDDLAKETETLLEKSLKDMPNAWGRISNGLQGLSGDLPYKIVNVTSSEAKLIDAEKVLERALGRAMEEGLSKDKQEKVQELIRRAKSLDYATSVTVALDILNNDARQVLSKPSIEYVKQKTEIHGGVHTDGGAFISGKVKTEGGDFVGRDNTNSKKDSK